MDISRDVRGASLSFCCLSSVMNEDMSKRAFHLS